MDDLLVSLYSIYIHAHAPGVTYCVHIITDGSVDVSLHLAWLVKRCVRRLRMLMPAAAVISGWRAYIHIIASC